MKKSLFLIPALCVLFAACSEQDRPAPQPQSASDPATAPSAPVEVPESSAPLSVFPASVASCDPIVATVSWDARKIDTGIDQVEIWVGIGDDSKIWIHTSAYGKAETGPWAGAGAQFVLKNHANGEELARAVVQGPACAVQAPAAAQG